MKKALILLTSLTLIVSCGSSNPATTGSDPSTLDPDKPVNPPAEETPPTTVFIPEAGSPVGTTNGKTEYTVYLTPNEKEIQLINYINEFRSEGTIRGNKPIGEALSCLINNGFQKRKLNKLNYNGILAYSARMHSIYLMNNRETNPHVETNKDSEYFYGKEFWDRSEKASLEFTDSADFETSTDENISLGDHSEVYEHFMAQVESKKHCEIILKNGAKDIGVGLAENSKGFEYTTAITIVFGK